MNTGTKETTQLEVMRILEGHPRLSQRKLASLLQVSLGKANYCLRGLIAKGVVKAENYRSSSNKTAYLYLLTPRGVVAKGILARRFLARRIEEYDQLVAEIETLRREAEGSDSVYE